jgi:hypothetical protein
VGLGYETSILVGACRKVTNVHYPRRKDPT